MGVRQKSTCVDERQTYVNVCHKASDVRHLILHVIKYCTAFGSVIRILLFSFNLYRWENVKDVQVKVEGTKLHKDCSASHYIGHYSNKFLTLQSVAEYWHMHRGNVPFKSHQVFVDVAGFELASLRFRPVEQDMVRCFLPAFAGHQYRGHQIHIVGIKPYVTTSWRASILKILHHFILFDIVSAIKTVYIKIFELLREL